MGEDIVYPICIKYRAHWDEWTIVREFMQNAMDAADKFNCEFGMIVDEKGILIWDNGLGMNKKDMLLGYSSMEKIEGDYRGRFGEGAKMAMVVALRLGYGIEIESYGEDGKGIKIVPSKDTLFDEDVLKLKIYKIKGNKKGTYVRIYGLKRDYRDRFIFGNENEIVFECFHGRLLEGHYTGKLFSKGIYVMDIQNSIFGYDIYNIKLEEGRSIASDFEIKMGIGDIWSNVDKKELWEKLFENFSKFLEDTFEWDMYIWYLSNDTKKAIKCAWNSLYGDDAVLITDVANLNIINYYGKKSIVMPKKLTSLMKKIVLTDFDFLRKKDVNGYIVDDYELDLKEYINLMFCRRIGKIILEKHGMEFYSIDAYKLFGNTLGFEKWGKIGINVKQLKEKKDAVSTLIHELAHAIYKTNDSTEEHRDAVEKIAGEIIEYMSNEKNIKKIRRELEKDKKYYIIRKKFSQ